MKLGQKIFVTTTLLLKPQIFKLHLTAIQDAYTNSSEKEMRIKMGDNHNWGACPTRLRSEVVIEPSDLDTILSTRSEWLDKKREKEAGNKQLYYIEFRVNDLSICELSYSNTINSLKEGHYKAYSSEGAIGSVQMKIPVGQELPEDCFHSIDEAFKVYKEKLTQLI
jgi:hypothetical protein